MPATFPYGSNVLASIKHFAAGGDKYAIALLAIMEGTQTALLTPAAQASRTIRVAGQLQDQDGILVAAIKTVLVRLRQPLLAPGVQVDVATTAALGACTAAGTGVGKTLTLNTHAALVVDGITITNGMRVLVKNQVAGADNGIYTQTTLGDGSTSWVLTRATDFDAVSAAEIAAGANYRIAQGATNGGKTFVHTTIGVITVETTALVFTDNGVVGTLALGAAGATVIGGASTKELYLTTAADGSFSVDVLSQLAGVSILEVIEDNGETELLTLTYT